MIERDCFTREFPRMTPIEWCDDWADENSTRRHCDRCERDPRIGDRVRPTNLDMIPQEESIPSRVFRFVRELSKQPRVGKGAELRCIKCKLHEPLMKVLISRK